MSDLDNAESRISGWLQPLDGEAGPCGPDLEYDNDFLRVEQAAAGRPETPFGPAEPPDWPQVRELAAALLDRSRDLRIAVLWLRSGVRIFGYPGVAIGLRLVNGMLESLWDGMHPLPDPDDGDPYARVNALTALRESEGLLGDLRACHIVRDHAVGELTGRQVELADALAEPFGDEQVPALSSLRHLMLAAVEQAPKLQQELQDVAKGMQRMRKLADDRLGSDAPDFKPLCALVDAVASLLPQEQGAATNVTEAVEKVGRGGGALGRSPSPAVTSPEQVLRAIDMVCAYLEHSEPTNPAPQFLRRARQLVGHNFLQLMAELAPGALREVDRMVGVDPDRGDTPGPS